MQPLILAILLAPAAAPPMPWKLTAEEKRYLDGLANLLVDPRIADRVSVRVMDREDRRPFPKIFRKGEESNPTANLWRIRGKAEQRSRVVAPDGREVFPLGGIKRIDFVE